MALQTSGSISMAQISGEFGLGYAISSYYRDSSDPYIGTIPASGTISPILIFMAQVEEPQD